MDEDDYICCKCGEAVGPYERHAIDVDDGTEMVYHEECCPCNRSIVQFVVSIDPVAVAELGYPDIDMETLATVMEERFCEKYYSELLKEACQAVEMTRIAGKR